MTKARAHRFTNRELSWLSFNERVLQEAANPSVPLGERLNFLAIFSSNLDEFFRVRVASLRSLLRLKPKRVERLGINPARVLRQIHGVVSDQQNRFGDIFQHEVVPALAGEGIALIDETRLTHDEATYLRADFTARIAPLIRPIELASDAPVPFLENRGLHLVVELWPAEDAAHEVWPEHALVPIPSPPLPRFVVLPQRDGPNRVLFLDDVVRLGLPALFPDHEVGNAFAVKLSRDADLYLEDEFSGSLVDSIRKGLKKRETGLPCRFLYDRNAPYPLVRKLRERFGLDDEDLVIGGRYHNLHDLADFPRFDRSDLSNPSLPPLPHPVLDSAPSVLAAIAERDHMLHFPYHRFDSVIRMLDEAAHDPAVSAIWISLYRLAPDSAVARALIAAAENGKRVTAFVEAKARFDEESNLLWAERLEAAGVRTLYSMPGLKVHAKLALIERVEEGAVRRYAYLGTGNFNERTACVYTDHALLTSDPELTEEVARVFAFLAGELENPAFEHLMVAPFDMRKRLYALIEQEALAARAGRRAGITLKINSLEDPKIIARLYDASLAGVPIELIVRGICCLVPGAPGMSETVRARSIVDRFLEHGRIFVFENGGAPAYWLASADWMSRNLSRRIEVAFPIRDPGLQHELRTVLDLSLADNCKARVLDDGQTNRYVPEDGAIVRAQHDVYRYFEAQLGEVPARGTLNEERHRRLAPVTT